MYTRVPPLPTAHTSRRGCGQRGLALLCTVSRPISWQSHPWKNWPPADTLGLWVTQQQSTHFLEEKLWVLLVERLPREPCDPLLVAEKIVTNLPTCQWVPYANLKFNFHNFAHSVDLIWCPRYHKCKSLKFTLQNIQIAMPLLPIILFEPINNNNRGSLASPPLLYCDLYTHTDLSLFAARCQLLPIWRPRYAHDPMFMWFARVQSSFHGHVPESHRGVTRSTSELSDR